MAPTDAPPDFAPLRTERLALRALRKEDAAALHRLVNDWEVAKTLARVPFPYPRALADEWIASTWAQIAAGEAWHLAVAGADDALLGCAGLTLDRRGGRAELGYWIGRPHWGKGLGPEAAGRLARWALDEVGVSTVHASALRDNARSVSVLRRLGFRGAGEGAQVFLSRGGGPMPVLLFEAGRAELAAAAQPQPSTAEPAAGRVLLVVACALVDPDGRVLLARRPEGKPMAGLWEFPGGKVDPGETEVQALVRELREELAVEAVVGDRVGPDLDIRGTAVLRVYLCTAEGEPALVDHDAHCWLGVDALDDVPWIPVDAPVVEALRAVLSPAG